MIKYSKSLVHEQKVVTFFKGKSVAASSLYLFDESKLLFAEENLGVNLFEYDEAESIPFIVNSNKEMRTLFGGTLLSLEENEKVSVIDIRLIDSEQIRADFFYDEQLFSDARTEVLQDILSSYSFDATFNKFEDVSSGKVISGLDSRATSYLQLILTTRYLKTFGQGISERLKNHFDENRYVDSQVFMFLLMTTLSGTSEF